jgi:hypothetical protein
MGVSDQEVFGQFRQAVMASKMFNGSLSLKAVASRLSLFKTSIGHSLDTLLHMMFVLSDIV